MTWSDEHAQQLHLLTQLTQRAFPHPQAMLRVVVYRYEQLIRDVELEAFHQLSIGHAHGCDLQLPPHPKLAARHLTLCCDKDQGWVCTDHHSPGGTTVHGRRFYDQISLRPWDELGIGPYTIQLQDTQLPLQPCKHLKSRPNPIHLMLCDAHGVLDKMSILTPKLIKVGRASSCDLTIPGTNVSRVHLSLRPQGQGWILEDGGSKNGTRVNGQPLQSAALHVLDQGDVIELGSLRLLVSLSIEPEFEQLPFEPETSYDSDPDPDAPCMPYLVRIQDSKGGIKVITGRHNELVIGRGVDADVLIQEEHVSRHHARLIMKDSTLFLEPCQPHAVVYINGRRARARCVLSSQDEIFIGSHRLVFLGLTHQQPMVVHTQAVDVLVQLGASSWTRTPFTKRRLSIGRMPQCDITLKSPKVSRLHAWIEVGAHGLRIIDNESTNGVMHRTRLIQGDCELDEREVVSIGGFKLYIESSTLNRIQGINDDQEGEEPPQPF